MIKRKWDSDQMQDLGTATGVVHQGLRDTLALMETLFKDIEADTTWAGGHKVAFVAWMDLLRQYHSQLAVPEIGGEAASMVNEFARDSAAFYIESSAMLDLMRTVR